MKEATGEVSMTLITIIAVGVIGALLAFFWPQIQDWLQDTFDETINAQEGYTPQ